MNKVAKTSMGLALLTAGLLLTSCAGWTVKGKVSCSKTLPDGDTKCTAGVSASKTIGSDIRALAHTLTGGIPDASEYSLDISGSTVPYPNTGQATVTLRNSSTNTVVAAKMFPWVRSGDTIVFANPSAVNAWIAGVTAPVDEVAYQLAPFDTHLEPGSNVLHVSTIYDGQTLTSVTKNICYNPHTPPTNGMPTPCL